MTTNAERPTAQDPVSQYMGGYVPQSISAQDWARWKDEVMALVRASAPSSPDDAKGLIGALCAFMGWSVGMYGGEGQIAPHLTAVRIDEYIRHLGHGEVAPGTRENKRARLRRIERSTREEQGHLKRSGGGGPSHPPYPRDAWAASTSPLVRDLLAVLSDADLDVISLEEHFKQLGTPALKTALIEMGTPWDPHRLRATWVAHLASVQSSFVHLARQHDLTRRDLDRYLEHADPVKAVLRG